ncbi:hypothetical protein N0V87_006253 [Didymella glomerata]|uniref:Uncharacterized protein n=1 Tax=Didymella glomerata TaxID=749621 RepID=A0A9W9BYP2_9PLEO|nr:hypothetical protein N0V87_006253 [Didymella glomerata]
MSVLAFKALGYGAEQIPDKFFEKIPGGFFKPEDEKKNSKKSRSPPKEESRRSSDRSRRERSPQNDYSDSSGRDTDKEEQRRKERRRRKSAARSTSRSLSRGRDKQRSRDVDGEYSGRDMAYPEQGPGQGPYFPPPPTFEYAPYNPQEHASRPSQGDYRPTSAQPQHGYATQLHMLHKPPPTHPGTATIHRRNSTANSRARSPRSTKNSITHPTTLAVLTNKLLRTTTATPPAAAAAPSTTAENIGIELGLQIPAVPVVTSPGLLWLVPPLERWVVKPSLLGMLTESRTNMEAVFHPVRAHVLDTESTTIATAAATARVAEGFELEAEVLLTASARSLEDERIVTTAATVADAMNVIFATVITTAIAVMTAMTGVDAATEAETIDDRIADTRSMRTEEEDYEEKGLLRVY